jgi:glycosyltransferase involved in cell wall biosynthesis
MARVCVIRQWYVPNDPRVKREVDALIDAGHSVEVICMRLPGDASREVAGRLSIHRLPMTHRRGGLARYLFEYIAFPIMAGITLARLDRARRFDLVQVHTVPDWLVFAAALPRRRGVPVLIDLQEVMPEFFRSKFRARADHLAVRLLARLEQASIRFASAAVTCTEEMRAAFIARGAAGDHITVVMNSTDESVFDSERYQPRPRDNGRFALVSHGTIEERYGVDTMIHAIARLRDRIPGLTLDVYGDGSCVEELRALVDELELAHAVTFHGFVPIDQLLTGIADADAGVVAMKPDVFRDLTHCNKMFDLITMRRPVICSRTTSVMEHFPDGCLQYFDGGDDADLALAIAALYEQPDLAERLVANASSANEKYRWPRQRERYLTVVDALLSGGAAVRDAAPGRGNALPAERSRRVNGGARQTY